MGSAHVEDLGAGHDAAGRMGAQNWRAHFVHVDERSVWRSARASPARDVLGSRQPYRHSLLLQRGQAGGRNTDDGYASRHAVAQYVYCAAFQHVWTSYGPDASPPRYFRGQRQAWLEPLRDI